MVRASVDASKAIGRALNQRTILCDVVGFVLFSLLIVLDCQADAIVDTAKYSGRDLRFVGVGYLGIWESQTAKQYGCGRPTTLYLVHSLSKPERRYSSSDHEVATLPRGAVFHIDGLRTYEDCCQGRGQGGGPVISFRRACITSSVLVGSYLDPKKGKLSFSLPLELLQKGQPSNDESLRSYGPAIGGSSIQRDEFLDTPAFQFADDQVPALKTEVQRAIERVERGTPDVRVANLQYLGTQGDSAKAALPAILAALEYSDQGVRRAAAEAIAAIGYLDDTVANALVRAQGVRTSGEATNSAAINTALHLGLKQNNMRLARSSLSSYSRMSFIGYKSPPPALVEAFASEDLVIAKLAVDILRQYLAVSGGAISEHRGGVAIKDAFSESPVDGKLRMLSALEIVASRRSSSDSGQATILNGAMSLYHEALSDPDGQIRIAAMQSLAKNLDHDVSHSADRLGLIRVALPAILRADEDGSIGVRAAARDVRLKYPDEFAHITRTRPNNAKKTDVVSGASTAEKRSPQIAPTIVVRGASTSTPEPSGYFPDPFKTKCRALGAFRDGLSLNPPEGPQNLRYQSNKDETITFSWSCPNDHEFDAQGRRRQLKKSSFNLFCCDCSNQPGAHVSEVKDEAGRNASEITLRVQPGMDYSWGVTCENVRRYSNELLPRYYHAHSNVARLGKPGTIMQYRHFSGTYSQSVRDEYREMEARNKRAAEESGKRFDKGLAAAKDKKKFIEEWNAGSHR